LKIKPPHTKLARNKKDLQKAMVFSKEKRRARD